MFEFLLSHQKTQLQQLQLLQQLADAAAAAIDLRAQQQLPALNVANSPFAIDDDGWRKRTVSRTGNRLKERHISENADVDTKAGDRSRAYNHHPGNRSASMVGDCI